MLWLGDPKILQTTPGYYRYQTDIIYCDNKGFWLHNAVWARPAPCLAAKLLMINPANDSVCMSH